MAIKIYADGADLETMAALAGDPKISGFTTNPTLARKAGVGNYLEFCKRALQAAGDKPVSLEVLSDEPPEILRQALLLADLAPNAVVKVPVMNSHGLSLTLAIGELTRCSVPLNITAVFTCSQVSQVAFAMTLNAPSPRTQTRTCDPPIVSVFAGRIADAGVDPLFHLMDCRHALSTACPSAQLLWASPRQSFDLILARRAGCDIITMTPDLIAKTALHGKNLYEYSRETVEMFYRDAQVAKFEL